MDNQAIEAFGTPLEQALAGLPQVEPPEGLRNRCLAALEAAPQKSGGWESWRQLVVAAAVFVMLVGVAGVLFPPFAGVREKARSSVRTLAPAAPPPSAMGPTGPATAGPEGRARRSAFEERLSSRRTAVDRVLETLPEASSASSVASPPPGGVTGYAGRSYRTQATPPPWRDESGQRRKMTERTVEMEVPQVEEGYKQAVGIVEKAGGFVLNEELSIKDRGQDEVHLFCKIPVEQFEGVLAQVRELGKVVLVTGQSQDMTLQYEEEGADVRAMAAEIERLSAEMEKATGRQKEVLRQKIEALKRELEEQKQGMRQLRKATSYAQLSLTMKEARGLRYFVSSAAREALPLAMSLALIAVPLLVLALVWKRKR